MRITALTIELTMALGLGALGAQSDMAGELPIAAGPFQPTMQSLTNYHCPKWFRDAKFGIWAHWGPQAVPMDGDWYARQMYQQGSAQYKDHLERYGHPSTNGYKDIIPLWKAEKWDPDRLMALYKRAGARYFVSMGSHHDNFFLWNSKLHRWNAVKMGPKRDVVGDWQKAAPNTACASASPSIWAPVSPGSRTATNPTPTARWRVCLMTGPIRVRKTSIISPPNPATPVGTAPTRAGSASGSAESRSWWTTTALTCSIPTAASRSATKSGAA